MTSRINYRAVINGCVGWHTTSDQDMNIWNRQSWNTDGRDEDNHAYTLVINSQITVTIPARLSPVWPRIYHPKQQRKSDLRS